MVGWIISWRFEEIRASRSGTKAEVIGWREDLIAKGATDIEILGPAASP